MHTLIEKAKEVLIAVLPVVIFVVILRFTIVPIPNIPFFQFLLGAVAVKIGLIVLLFGVELAILPLGENMGTAFVKSNKLWFIIITVFILGFFINFAEPDVNVLAKQVAAISNNIISTFTIRTLVALGAATLLALGAIRIVKNYSLRKMLIIAYTLAFLLSLFVSSDFVAIAFDASGAATGAITVPLVLALALGMASMKRDSKSAEENSFGLVGIMASGAIFGVLLLKFFLKTEEITGSLPAYNFDNTSVFGPFLLEIPIMIRETFLSLMPILVLFLIFQKYKFHLSHIHFRRMLIGFFYTFSGLVIFFVGVHAGFMNMGSIIGYQLAKIGNPIIPIGLGAILGMLIILTEPAVYVLTHQIEDVTNGYIRRKTILTFLSIGMAFAVGLSMLKIIVPSISLWHYILPGYCFSLIMMFFTPKIFTGISFDSGAVSSGPMTVTFILAYSQGVAEAVPHADVFKDSFGIIVMVTMMPVIALLILGYIYKMKSKKVGVD
ncbi:MAG: DUF1538 domain-containing protein [Candidatus Cloacimonetes bacterium]|nr:DUF1538 domain-containing protein [Candidatus Cloacimonadota bacterium]